MPKVKSNDELHRTYPATAKVTEAAFHLLIAQLPKGSGEGIGGALWQMAVGGGGGNAKENKCG